MRFPSYLFALLAMLLAAHRTAGAFELVDRIVAVIDNQVILWSELNFRLRLELEGRGYSEYTEPARLDSLRRATLDEMIDEHVLVLKAQKDSVEVDPAEVEKMVNEQFRRIKSSMSAAELDLMLQQVGLTERQLKQRYRKEIRQRLLYRQMRDQVASRLHISRREVETFREAHQDTLPQQISVSDINIKVRPSEGVLAARRAVIEELQRRLAAGEDFAEMARQNSEDPGTAAQGGDLGCFDTGQLMPEFEEAASALKPGEISQPVLTRYGYHLIRLQEKREGALCASHILVMARSTDRDQARVREELTALRERALAGEDFAALARTSSQDPETSRRGGLLWDVIERDQIPPFLAPHLRGMHLGEISRPFFLDDGGHILRINDDQATLEMLVREQRIAQNVELLIDEYEEQIHIDRRLNDESMRQPADGTLGRIPEKHGSGQTAQ